jgi:hypothetical protein
MDTSNDKGLHEEIVRDSDGLEIGLIDQYHNGLSLVWTFEVAGGPQATLSYMTKRAALFGLLRVAYGKAELISFKKAAQVAVVNVSKGTAHVAKVGRRGYRVLGIVTNVRIVNDGDGELVYLTFDDDIELVFDADDVLEVVE